MKKEVGITMKSKETSSKLVRNSHVTIMHQPVTASSQTHVAKSKYK